MNALGEGSAVAWGLSRQEMQIWLAVVEGRGALVTFARLAKAMEWEWVDEGVRQQVRVQVSRINQKADRRVICNVPRSGYRLSDEALSMLGIGGPCPSCGRTDDQFALGKAADAIEGILHELRVLQEASR